MPSPTGDDKPARHLKVHTWRYRMVRDSNAGGGRILGTVGVCEVYTDEKTGRHYGWSDPISLHGDDRDELREQFLSIARALIEPILKPDADGNYLIEEE